MVRSAVVKRTSLSAFLSALLAALAWAPAAPAQPVPSWYTSRMTVSEGPILVEHFWSKGRRMRAQTVIAGRPIITLVDEKHYVIYDEMSRTGISIGRSPIAIAQDEGRGRPFGREGDRILAEGAEKVGSAVLAGQDADHYRITDARGRREVWLTRDELHVPIQVSIRDRRTGSERNIQYLDWNTGGSFDDAFFQTPPGAQIEEMSYDEYVERSKKGAVGPAPPFYADLLHGVRKD